MPAEKPAIELNEILLRSETYKDFLREAFAALKKGRQGYSLAVFARAAGCSSRSYPREVITGRRRLSLDFAGPFAAAVGLKGDGKILFLKLVELERAEDKTALLAEIAKVRQRIRNRVERPKKAPRDLFLRSSWIDVFASLGSTGAGVTLEDICRRTQFSPAEARECLEGMLEKGIVRLEESRYFAVGNHHFFEDLEHDALFERRYLEILERVGKRARKSMRSERDLFLCTTASVRPEDVPRLKRQLRAVVNRFVQDAEAPDGDCLVHLSVGFIS